ncbi:MAG: DUF58 domain-containing protein [Pseudomonadota bacterium]
MMQSASDSVINGAYVELSQLLRLRHKPMTTPTLQSRIVGNRAGLKLSKIKGRGVDFSEVRTYQPGDDVRTIDWRVTARKNKPHTKVFREERERPNLIVVDQTQYMFFGSKLRLKSVVAAELAARIAWQNLNVGDRVGGIVIGNADQALHKPFRTTKAVARLLHDISHYNRSLQRDLADPSASIAQGMLQIRRLTQTNYRIFVLSDFAGSLDAWREHLHQLARHNQVVVVHIADPLEAELPPSDHYLITDGKDRLQLFTGDVRTRESYRTRFLARADQLRRICAHQSMEFLSISTTDTHLDGLHWV